MVILYTVNAAFLMMTPAALVFTNIFMGVMILAYGLFFELPVVGLPVFYLLTLYCQSNAPASPMAIGNSLSDVMYVAEFLFAIAGDAHVSWADILALVVNLVARFFLDLPIKKGDCLRRPIFFGFFLFTFLVFFGFLVLSCFLLFFCFFDFVLF